MQIDKKKYPNCFAGDKYARDVVDGKIVANIYIKGACERYLRDVDNQEANFWFDIKAAEKYLRLAQKFEHVVGHWATKNIVYEPWQCFVFMNIMGFKNKTTKFRRFRIAHLEVARGNAKAFCTASKVVTPDGVKFWGDIKIGSRLYDRSGNICRVIGKNEVHYPQAYEIEFSDGEKLICSDQHLWFTSSKTERVRQKRHRGRNLRRTKTLNTNYESVRTTEEIAKSIRVGEESNHAIFNTAPIKGRKSKLPINPYLLGYWLGNGDSMGSKLHCHEKDLNGLCELLAKRKVELRGTWRRGNRAYVNVGSLERCLKESNLWGNKHIPDEYFSAPIEDRLELVRGLLDSDGSINPDNQRQVGFTNKNHSLVDGLFILLCSLGYKPTRKTFKVSKENNFKSDTIFKRLNFTPRGDIKVFNFNRKSELQFVSMGSHSYAGKRYVVGCRKLKKKYPMFCVEVDSPDKSYLIGENMIPTHNSTMASQLLLYFLALDNPNGNQVSTVATKRDQARIVLDSARGMARKNSSFLRHTGVKVLAHSIVHSDSNSVARAMSADYGGLDGLQDVLAVCDELHAMDRKVFEVITSGMSKRKDSLTMCITTAGDDTQSVGYYQTQYAKKVSTGEVDDDSFFAAVYTLDDGDLWSDESVWIKANPGLGGSVDLDSLRAKVEKAIVTPSDIPNIRIKHMNEWISEAHAFFDLGAWDKCADPTLKIENFKGKTVRLGLDLASHIDIASIGYVFRENGIYYVFDESYLPEDTIAEKYNAFYDSCIADGSLRKAKGAVINYENIQDRLKQAAKDFKPYDCMYDPWNATETAQKVAESLEMVKVPMNTANLSEPLKRMDSLIRSGKLRHNGSKLLRWCIGNVVAKEDHNGNVFPRKSHEKLKIDPVVAILLAFVGWVANEEPESVYSERGIRTL